jgi:hypothetical protein
MRTATRDGGERASGRPALGEGVYWSVMSIMPGADGAGNITVTITPAFGRHVGVVDVEGWSDKGTSWHNRHRAAVESCVRI